MQATPVATTESARLSPRRAAVAVTLAALALLAGCDLNRTPLAPAPARPKERAPAAVTLLYTTDEHGWLLPTTEKGEVRGGAAEMLAQWVEKEHHCAGRVPGQSPAVPPSPPECKDPTTLALSGGDNWTGPAISSYFLGVPMADAMARMGYAASAFGNHEFDFGRDVFLSNKARAGYPYLAANLRVKDPSLAAFALPAFTIFERRGVKIGVVGLATENTLAAAMASRFEGLEFQKEEEALARAIPDAWRAEPDALVLIAHECPDKLEPILARHPEWNLAFVGAGHCHKKMELKVSGVPVVNPGWRMRSYARVRLDIDPRRPRGARVAAVTAEVIDLSRPEGAPAAPPDKAIAAASQVWQKQLDAALGEQIGYSAGGMEKDSPEIGQWVARSWRNQLGVDIAILNKDGIRQSVPSGAITKATVYSVLPFDNKLLICSLTGSDVLENVRKHEAVFAGLSAAGDGRYVLEDGRPLDPGARYTVATIDFLYFGGDDFHFQAKDPAPRWTGLDWRAPVIEWTKALGTSPSAPLERRIR